MLTWPIYFAFPYSLFVLSNIIVSALNLTNTDTGSKIYSLEGQGMFELNIHRTLGSDI